MRRGGGTHRGFGLRSWRGRHDVAGVPRVRYRALVRITANDGAVTYEQSADEAEASALLNRHPGAAVDVVVVQECGYRDGRTQRYRIWRTLAHAAVAPGNSQTGTTAGSECMRGLISARKALAGLAARPAAHHIFIEQTDDGYLVIGRAERVVETVVGYFFVADKRVQERRFDPTQPDAAQDTAEYLVELLHVVERANEQQDRQADEQQETIIDGNVRAEQEQERRHRSDELEAALLDIASRWGATP
jgi:hypothetical protein